jgi:hypothetical protein
MSSILDRMTLGSLAQLEPIKHEPRAYRPSVYQTSKNTDLEFDDAPSLEDILAIESQDRERAGEDISVPTGDVFARMAEKRHAGHQAKLQQRYRFREITAVMSRIKSLSACADHCELESSSGCRALLESLTMLGYAPSDADLIAARAKVSSCPVRIGLEAQCRAEFPGHFDRPIRPKPAQANTVRLKDAVKALEGSAGLYRVAIWYPNLDHDPPVPTALNRLIFCTREARKIEKIDSNTGRKVKHDQPKLSGLTHALNFFEGNPTSGLGHIEDQSWLDLMPAIRQASQLEWESLPGAGFTTRKDKLPKLLKVPKISKPKKPKPV